MSTAEQLIPDSIGPYKVIKKIGEGGIGRVYLGTEEATGRLVAIKMLHEKFMEDEKFLGVFHKELMIMARLQHKHIVPYIDNYFNPPECYVVSEFIDGWSGHSFLRQVDSIPPLIAICIIFDMLQGIDYLHLHDTVHADLSSANYMINKVGRVYVADFGLACQLEIEDYKKFMVGTPGYHSPEHITEASLSSVSDIFCVGLLFYELLTKERAVQGSTERDVLLNRMKSIDYTKVVCGDRTLNKDILKILKTATSFDLSKRFQSTEKMMYACYNVLKKYNIIYPRHAIFKFLVDKNLSPGPFKGHEHDIYQGV